MIARSVRARSGITLTEILISILIMGIGLISLATLFPLGLIRLRDAARFQRGASLVQSATDDTDARALLFKPSFAQTWYGTRDPFTTDTSFGTFANPITTVGAGKNGLPQPGLLICYDPLWRAITNVVPRAGNFNPVLYDGTLDFSLTYTGPTGNAVGIPSSEARFGAGVVVTSGGTVNAYNLRTNAPGDGGFPSAYGLQRITNFIPWSSNKYTALYPFTYHNPNLSVFPIQAADVSGDVFTSIDDIVFNSTEGATKGSSPLVPDLTLTGNGTPISDWRYTWFFTGRQVDSVRNDMFQGDVVICDGRQFAFSPLPSPNATVSVPVGETVVEAIFGYSTNIGSTGLAVGADKSVLLRWPATIADPTVRTGGWIADVTYERDAPTSTNKTNFAQTPFQRCNWYQVSKKTDAIPDPDFAGYRRMIVTTSSPVKTKTLLNVGGIPQFVNVALIMPSVIYVYPRTFTL